MQRFVSQDPIGFGAGDTNLYRYCRNSPINYTDPSGEEPVTLAVLGITALAIGLFGRESLYHAAAQYDAASQMLAKPNFSAEDAAQYNALLQSAQRWHVTGNVAGGAAIAVAAAPLLIPMGASVLAGGGMSASWATGLAIGGYTAGATHGTLSTIAAGPNAGSFGVLAGPAMGGGFGAFMPYATFGSLGFATVGGAIDYKWGSGRFFGTGYQVGGLLGGLVGGGIPAGLRGGIWAGAREMLPSAIGGGIGFGYGYYRTRSVEDALFWANIGMFAGGMSRMVYNPMTFRRMREYYWSMRGAANGRSLHHWLFPQRLFGQNALLGLKSAPLNHLELPALRGVFYRNLTLNTWMGFARSAVWQRAMPNEAFRAALIENGIRMGIPLAAAALGTGGYYAGSYLDRLLGRGATE